jgi:hypothetical protein
MAPPLSHIETVFYQNMRRIRRHNYNCAEELRILIHYHEGDIDSGRDRIFTRSENEYIIRRYQAELNALPNRYIPRISSGPTQADTTLETVMNIDATPALLQRNILRENEYLQNRTPIILQGRRVTGASPLSFVSSAEDAMIFNRQMYNISRPLRHPGGRL